MNSSLHEANIANKKACKNAYALLNTIKADPVLKKKPKQHKAFKPTVAVYGLLNAGKSYLLNMLTSHTDDEFFKCSDARETVALKTFEGEKYIYLDTPGLDANNDDDLTAYQGRDQANILLFVHQASSELDKLEVNFLQDVKHKLGNSMKDSVILVISKIDNLGNQADLKPLTDKIVSQWTDIFGYTPIPFAVSGKRYLAGVQNNKPRLIKLSGINQLKDHIDVLNSKADYEAFDAEKDKIQFSKYIEQLMQERAKLIASINEVSHAAKDEFVAFSNQAQSFIDSKQQYQRDIANLNQQLANANSELQSKKRELDNSY